MAHLQVGLLVFFAAVIPVPTAWGQTPGLVIPRAETGADQWHRDHPEWDGRDVVIAVFDSGVDPGAAGLQKTTDGRPKIVDLIDGTGGGDVHLKPASIPDGTVTVKGQTGRTLTLPAECVGPGQKLHVGSKSGRELFPGPVLRRWQDHVKQLIEAETKQAEDRLRSETGAGIGTEEVRQRMAELRRARSLSRADVPVFDCVTYFAHGRWWARIDTDQDGDLRDEQRLNTYREAPSVGLFPEPLHVHFTVNIWNDGRNLSIVVPSNDHGTHVAGIIAAHVPGDPDQDGIAPGARIVSVKIGDTRLGGMETGSGIERGIAAVLRNGCHLVNMSYGEPTGDPLRGRLAAAISRLVHEHGVVFVSSAMNEGPALSTLGAPGGTVPGVIGVGAWLSSAMMRSMYTVDNNDRSTAFRWTSRGPTDDGGIGVDIFAPGAAIAPIPRWSGSGAARMNGTSMASPNTCGAIALLLSGLHADNRTCRPPALQQALKAAARPLDSESPLTRGAGLLQIPGTWEILDRMSDSERSRRHLTVRVAGRLHERGIHLRETWQQRHRSFNVGVRPHFISTDTVADRADYQMTIRLVSNRPWITCGSMLRLNAAGQSFAVTVNPEQLPPGVHTGTILGVDADAPEFGPVIEIPVTVIRKHPLVDERRTEESGDIPPGSVLRRFIDVPAGARRMHVELTNLTDEEIPGLMVQTIPVRPGTAFRHLDTGHYTSLEPQERIHLQADVSTGGMHELAIAQPWRQPLTGRYRLSIHFSRVSEQSAIEISPHETTAILHVQNQKSLSQEIDLDIRFTARERLIHPASALITPLLEQRDQGLRNAPHHQLELVYEFSTKNATRVTPRLQSREDLLYESDTGGYVWSIQDGNGRMLGWGDIFPHTVSLPQGDFRLIVHLRGDSAESLERLQKTPAILSEPVNRQFPLTVHASPLDALSGSGSIRTLDLIGRERRELTLSSKGLNNQGAITIVPGAKISPLIHHRGELVFRPRNRSDVILDRISVGVSTTNLTQTSASGGSADRLISEPSDPVQAARLRQIRELSAESNPKELSRLVAAYTEDHPRDLSVHVARLHWLDDAARRKQWLPDVIEAADAVISRIPAKKMATDLSLPPSTTDRALQTRRRQAVRHRDILIDALYRKGRAVGYQELPDVLRKFPIADRDAHDRLFSETLDRLGRWVDYTQSDYVLLAVRDARRKQQWGRALRLLNSAESARGANFWYAKKRRDIYRELNWNELEQRETRRILDEFPQRYRDQMTGSPD